MKQKTARGILAAGALAALSVIGYIHLQQHLWITNLKSTSTCSPGDDEYFFGKLSGAVNADDPNTVDQEKVLKTIGNDCAILKTEGNPLVQAFDRDWADHSLDDQGALFAAMSDRSLFFTTRLLTNDPTWSHLTDEQFGKLAPYLAKVSPARRNLIAEKYRPEMLKAAQGQRDEFVKSVQALASANLPGDADTFGHSLKAAQDSFHALADLRAVAIPKPDATSKAIANAAQLLNAVVNGYQPLGGDNDFASFEFNQVIIGPETFIAGRKSGRYFLAVLNEHPQLGRILLHVPDDAGIGGPGVYGSWVRQAHRDEQARSDSHAWVFTYEAASQSERENLTQYLKTSRILVSALQKIATALTDPPPAAQAASDDAVEPIEVAFNREMSAVRTQKATAEITEQDIDRLAKILAAPVTPADWAYLAKLDSDYVAQGTACNTGDCAIGETIVAKAEGIIHDSGKPVYPGVKLNLMAPK